MITRSRFGNIKTGDFIIMKRKVKSPVTREVCSSATNGSVGLKRLQNYENYTSKLTVYLYTDIARKIIGIWKKKI